MSRSGKFDKIKISLQEWLRGQTFTRALEALECGLSFHTGTRKDGHTPEFSHQLEIAHYIRTLPLGENLENCLIVAFLHDVVEDHYTTLDALEARFGPFIRECVDVLTKQGRWTDKARREYYRRLGTNCVSSVVKGVDRMHNVQSMQHVFTVNKQQRYLREVERWVLPMLRQAHKAYPSQEAAYENIMFVLQGQIDLIRHIHVAQAKAR